MKSLTISEMNSTIDSYKINYFISSASFEERCISIASIMKDVALDNSIIFGTIDFDKRIIDNRQSMLDLLTNSTKKEAIDLLIGDPVHSFIAMIEACATLFIDDPKVLLFDITTFTHEYLLMLFRVLMERRRREDKILLTYVGAKSYSDNADNDVDKWLTKGVRGLRSIIGYPGYSDPSKKNHLIILVGFEVERTIKLIEEFEFDVVSLAFGTKDDSITVQNQKLNFERYSEIFNLYSHSLKFEISLTNPELVKNTLLTYISEFKDYNIVIAPMNNKISTIGAGLAAIENKEIQLFYLQANIYNTEAYSKVGDNYYLLEV